MVKRSLAVIPEKIQEAEDALINIRLTQEKLAEDLDFHRDTVNKFFTGKSVDRKIFVDVCDKLGLDWKKISSNSTEKISSLTTQIELVQNALNTIENGDYKLSSVIRKAIRIARLRHDAYNLLWLQHEMINQRNIEEKKNMYAEILNYISETELAKVENKNTAMYNERRRCLTLGEDYSVVYAEKVCIQSVPELEERIQTISSWIAESQDPIIKASLQSILGSHKEILKRIEQKVHDFLSTIEAQILSPIDKADSAH